jgi:hypothetical protein
VGANFARRRHYSTKVLETSKIVTVACSLNRSD